jgi:D-glycero-D-manno-heptose 1,7-bisphosphate phosphatase
MPPAATCDLTDAWLRIDARPMATAPAVFLDRDGTIIENVPYLADPAGVIVLPGARETIAAYRAMGFAIVIVTNQSGVARGLFDAMAYRAVEARVLECLGPGLVDAVYACPFHPEGGGVFGADHPWRKPRPGMLRDAASRFGVDLARSVMIGDSLSDIQAGVAAGVDSAIHVLTGHGRRERPAVENYAQMTAWEPGASSIRYADSIGEPAAIIRGR